MRLTFDRGTLLIDGASADAGAASVPGAAWDARVGAWRAPARRLCERVAPSALDWPPGAGRSQWRPPPLRPYQAAAVDAWKAAGRRGLVVLPTGSGKTRVAIAAMAAVDAPVLVLVPTRVLLHQWRGEIAAAYAGPVGQLGDGERQVERVTVATFESAWRRMDRLGDRFGLLVVDEAHHFGAGTRDEALEMSIAPWRLGLTATPPVPGSEARDALEALIGPVVLQLSIGDLSGRYLAEYSVVTLPVALRPEERRAHALDQACFHAVHGPWRRANPGASWPEFVAAVSRAPPGREALAAWRRMTRRLAFTERKAEVVGALLARHRDARVLVFTADNRAAYALARRYLITPLTCDIGRRERDEALARFRAGEVRALVSARVLNEGIDVPAAEVAVIVGATGGPREYVQRVGRLLRPAEGKRAVIYELVVPGSQEVARVARRRQALAPTNAHPA